jgi:PAS domain-containing protein
MKCLRCGWDTHAFEEEQWYLKDFCEGCLQIVLAQWVVNGTHQQLSLWACYHGQWFWDMGRTQSWDKKTRQMFLGNPNSTQLVTTDTFADAVHPDDRERVWETAAYAIEKHIVYEVEYRIWRPDGQMRWIHSEGNVYYDSVGNPSHMMGLNYDVTERPMFFMPDHAQ